MCRRHPKAVWTKNNLYNGLPALALTSDKIGTVEIHQLHPVAMSGAGRLLAVRLRKMAENRRNILPGNMIRLICNPDQLCRLHHQAVIGLHAMA